MNIKKEWMALMISIAVMGGCSQQMTASAEEIVSNAIEAGKEVEAYYAEATMKIYEKDQLKEESTIKEFVDVSGKRKVITEDKNKKQRVTALNDGKQLLMYDEGNRQAMSMDISNIDMPTSSPKDQMNMMLNAVKDSHKREIVGEEKINGFDTTHIKLTSKEKNDIMGDMDFWIDQKTWFVIKNESQTGDIKSVMEYKKIDFSPKFEENTFKLNIPDSIKIIPMEDMNKETEGTIVDAEAAIGKPFLQFNVDDATVESIKINKLKGELNRTEVNISYKNDEGPLFHLAVFKTPEGDKLKIKGNYKVRGQNAEYLELIRNISWDEDGVRYSLLIENPKLSLEDVLKMTEKMKLSSEE
ncbi:LolA family protein [Bacillus massiliigorillae]|uniref:LolA family protein n=1 Tax=Bacillus massiliigorillae TaxID=1243664 RepID=UPI00039F5920|nr:DUF2092 domain-containing protein [Bacillus massiliigorillae]